MKSCFFIGHREAEMLPTLETVVKQHITEYGVTDFFVGNYGHFDWMAAKAVLHAKTQYPNITLTLLIPYHPAERPIALPSGFDRSFYPPGMEDVPRRLAIVRANRYMVNHVEYLIAYAWHPASNARELVRYAEKISVRSALKITNLASK